MAKYNKTPLLYRSTNFLPDDYKQSVLDKISHINLHHMRLFLGILSFLLLLLILFWYSKKSQWDITPAYMYYFWIDIVCLSAMPFFALLMYAKWPKTEKDNLLIHDILLLCFCTVVMIWLGVSSAIELQLSGYVSHFIIGAFAIATGMYFRGWSLFLIYLIGFGAFAGSLMFLQEGAIQCVEKYVNILALIPLAWGTSRVLYNANLRNLTDRENLFESNTKLNNEIIERRQIASALEESEEKYRIIVEKSKDGITIIQKGCITFINQRLPEMLGYGAKDVMGKPFIDYLHPKEIKKVSEYYKQRMTDDSAPQSYETIVKHKNGTYLNIIINATIVNYKGEVADFIFIRDITEQKQTEKDRERLIGELQTVNEELGRIAITDSLTGIHNRGYIYKRFVEEVKRSIRNKNDLTIILTDLDHFKEINDTYGHQYGDTVLQKVSSTIKDSLREIDLVGRYGGEEFLILMPGANLEKGCIVAERIRQNVECLEWSQKHTKVTISGGIVEQTEDSATGLLKEADRLLYQAKSRGRNRMDKNRSN